MIADEPPGRFRERRSTSGKPLCRAFVREENEFGEPIFRPCEIPAHPESEGLCFQHFFAGPKLQALRRAHGRRRFDERLLWGLRGRRFRELVRWIAGLDPEKVSAATVIERARVMADGEFFLDRGLGIKSVPRAIQDAPPENQNPSPVNDR